MVKKDTKLNITKETSYINELQMKDIHNSIESCKLETGNKKYKNYIWPTLLSFMVKK